LVEICGRKEESTGIEGDDGVGEDHKKDMADGKKDLDCDWIVSRLYSLLAFESVLLKTKIICEIKLMIVTE
jgi:hypothetical protein